MIDRKYGMFIHHGISTFHDTERTNGTLPASSYNPTAVDTDNWARTARDAGMKYAILVFFSFAIAGGVHYLRADMAVLPE